MMERVERFVLALGFATAPFAVAQVACAEETSSPELTDLDKLTAENWNPAAAPTPMAKAGASNDPGKANVVPSHAWHDQGSPLTTGPVQPSGFINGIVPGIEVPVAIHDGQTMVGAGLNLEFGYSGSWFEVLGRYRYNAFRPGAEDALEANVADVGFGLQRSIRSNQHVLRLEPYGTAQHWNNLSQWLVGGGASFSYCVNYSEKNDSAIGVQLGARAEMLFGTESPLDAPLLVAAGFVRFMHAVHGK